MPPNHYPKSSAGKNADVPGVNGPQAYRFNHGASPRSTGRESTAEANKGKPFPKPELSQEGFLKLPDWPDRGAAMRYSLTNTDVLPPIGHSGNESGNGRGRCRGSLLPW